MTLPKKCGMPLLDQDIEGLRVHALVTATFTTMPNITPAQRNWRSWLVHCLVKTARHYEETRELVLAQISESTRPAEEMAKGRLLPLIDFSLAMEDCITSLDKAITCVQALAKKNSLSVTAVAELCNEMETLKLFRNKQEHIHLKIANGQTGQGPLVVTVADDGNSMKLLKLTMPFTSVYRLIDALYRDVSQFFPNFIASMPKAQGGTLQTSITGTLINTPGRAVAPNS